MQKTQNYQLNQYEPQDNFLRTDFNADNQKIDTALKALGDKTDAKADQTALDQTNASVAKKCEIYVGSYTGDGVSGRVIPLGRAPQAVLVKKPNNDTNFGSTEELKRLVAMAVRGVSGNVLNVTETGFQVTNQGHVNAKGETYIYFAFC